MATNFYFQNGLTPGVSSEQRLLEDLIIESIKIYGHDVYYLPRTSVKQDNILGEDVLSKFENAYPIEMYLNNIEGWEGSGELFTKFGIQITHQATFAVSKRRWEDVVGINSGLQLPTRPAEGDLIFFPKTNSMFEIKFVQHLDPFFQLGKFYIYSMQCELYQYSSEKIETGISEIDKLDNVPSHDLFAYNVLSQTGDSILSQSEYPILQETSNTVEHVPFSNTEDFEKQALDILDFTVLNPFGEF